jgi:hypothetical protein
MRSNLADIRWKDHKKFVRKGISFQPEYAELIDKISAERKITQREVIEEALKGFFGDPKI